MSTYFAILTQVGEAKLANAIALGHTLKLKKMGVGDGNGALPIPDRLQKALVHEVRRADLNQLAIDPANASQIIVEQVLPEDVGGWWLREIGIYDEAGDLCAVANCPPSYKPLMVEGSGRTQVVRVVLIVASTAAIELKIDPSVILATRQYADEQDIVVRAYSDTLMAKHLAALDPHPQYSMKEIVTPPKFDASKKLVNADFVQRAQGNLVRYAEVTESRSLTTEDMGCALYFPTAGKAITIPDPVSLGIPNNSGKCVKFFGLFNSGTILAAPGVSIGFDVGSVPSITIKPGQFLTLMATGAKVWQVIDSTAELWRNADFAAMLSSSGYQKQPGGMILQWGGGAQTPESGYVDVIFPIPFPNACFHVFTGYEGQGGSGSSLPSNINVGMRTKTGCRLFTYNGNALSAGITPSYFAIGN